MYYVRQRKNFDTNKPVGPHNLSIHSEGLHEFPTIKVWRTVSGSLRMTTRKDWWVLMTCPTILRDCHHYRTCHNSGFVTIVSIHISNLYMTIQTIPAISYDVHPFLPWFDHHLSLSCLVQGLAVMEVAGSPYHVPMADCMGAFHLN